MWLTTLINNNNNSTINHNNNNNNNNNNNEAVLKGQFDILGFVLCSVQSQDVVSLA